MIGSSSVPGESRYRQAFSNEYNMRRRSLRNKSGDKMFRCKFLSSKIPLPIIIIGASFTLLCSPFILQTVHISSSNSRRPDKWFKYKLSTDEMYASVLEINWSDVAVALEELSDSGEFKGTGYLNFDEDEMNRWNDIFPDSEHVPLLLDHIPNNVTWETLYPEWIDEEEEFEVSTCPALPQIRFCGKPRLDLIAVKLPCNRAMKNWSRDVVRFHLQMEVARIAAMVKGYRPVYVVLITECFPMPNLFSCKDLVVRRGNVWVYKPEPDQLREKLRVPVGSCELAVALNDKKNEAVGNWRREAYATILHSAQVYVCGAIVAAQSIRMTGSTRDLVILVDSTISEHHRSGLKAAGWKIHTIERIKNPKAEKDAYNEWNYSKFRLWQLTDYDKIIFIDADLLILRNIDFLFRMPEISAIGNNATLFNSGVMVIEPSNCTFRLLMDHIDDIESYNGGDQGYLNEIFTWWHRIPKRMNFLKHFWIGDEPQIKELKTHLFGADPPVLYVIHYLGLKPWLCFRDYDCNWNVDVLQEFASDVAHRTWWKVHDGMPENLQNYCLLRSKQKAALEWDRRQAEKRNYSDGHWRVKIRDPRLEICFQEFCFWESMLWHWGEDTNNSTTGNPAPPPASL